MTINEHQRYQLHQALENQLGTENAATLMAHLPPVGWAIVAATASIVGTTAALTSLFG